MIGMTYDMAGSPLAIASILLEIRLARAKSSYVSLNYIQMQLNYLYTAASEAIFSSFGGGAAYGGAQAVSRPGQETGILFLGKNWLDYIGEIMSKSGE